MRGDVPGSEPHLVSPQRAAVQKGMRLRREVWLAEQVHMEGDLARAVMLMDAIAQVERGVAATLRAMAKRDGSEASQRRLRLAEEAIKGADAAIERSKYLQRRAQAWREHVEADRLQHALDRAGELLADLAQAEDDIAGILTEMAAEDGTELDAQRRELADQASAAARHAKARAQALRELAGANAARPQSR